MDKFEELFWGLELALLENNVSVEVIDKIKEDLKRELVDKPLPRDVPAKIEETLKRTLTEILSFEKDRPAETDKTETSLCHCPLRHQWNRKNHLYRQTGTIILRRINYQ